MSNLRSTFVVFALILAAPVAAFAQAGGLPSATAPSNSEGTPSGGTGIVGSSRVGPSSAVRAPMTHSRRHRTHRRHHRHHTATTTTTGQ